MLALLCLPGVAARGAAGLTIFSRTGIGMERRSGSTFLHRSRHSLALLPKAVSPPDANSMLRASRMSAAALLNRPEPSYARPRRRYALTLSASQSRTWVQLI